MGEIKMELFAHRGSSGTHPENTLAAFKEAARLPVHGVELDVHLTKDGEIVVIHDEAIDRTSNGNGLVKDMTLQELKKYDYGSWFSEAFEGETISTLEEVFHVYAKNNHIINIELKSDVYAYEGLEEKVIALIGQYGFEERVIISSFNHEAIRKIKQLQPKLVTAALVVEVFREPLDYLHQLPTDGLHIYLPSANQSFVQEVSKSKIPVRVFTVNQATDIGALREIGVQSIFTDYPEEMLKYIK